MWINRSTHQQGGTKETVIDPRIFTTRYLRSNCVERCSDVAQKYFDEKGGGEGAPEGPMVVFVNSRSGGRHGPELKGRLQQLMGEEQPNEFVQYGLDCLERLASLGDACAKQTREKLRIMVARGDGTVGWVLGSLAELYKQGREPVPPVGIIPLGTGNNLSRSFGWGGSFPFAWKSAVKRSLQRAIRGPVCRLDSFPPFMSLCSFSRLSCCCFPGFCCFLFSTRKSLVRAVNNDEQ